MVNKHKTFQGFIEKKSGEIIMFVYTETSLIDDWFKGGEFPPYQKCLTFMYKGDIIEVKIEEIRSFWGEDLL